MSNKEIDRNRNINIDFLKGISIICVILIHSSDLFITNNISIKFISEISRVSVPIFIIIWAYFLEKSIQKKPDNLFLTIYNRFKHLFLVYLIWSIFYFLITCNWDTITIKKIITTHFSGYGWSGQYFFIILFQLLLIYPILQYLNNIKYLRILTIIISILYIIWFGYYNKNQVELLNKLSERPFIFWLPYVFYGMNIQNNIKAKFHPLVLFIIVLIPIDFYYFKSQYPYLKITVLISSILIVKYTIQNSFIKHSTIISKIGSNSMFYFLINPIVIYYLKIPFSNYLNKLFINNYLNSIVFVIFIVIIILICYYLLKILRVFKLDKYLV